MFSTTPTSRRISKPDIWSLLIDGLLVQKWCYGLKPCADVGRVESLTPDRELFTRSTDQHIYCWCGVISYSKYAHSFRLDKQHLSFSLVHTIIRVTISMLPCEGNFNLTYTLRNRNRNWPHSQEWCVRFLSQGDPVEARSQAATGKKGASFRCFWVWVTWGYLWPSSPWHLHYYIDTLTRSWVHGQLYESHPIL